MRIITTRPGILSKAQQSKLNKHDVLVIEVDNPDDVKILPITMDLADDDVLFAALAGVNESALSQDKFVKGLLHFMKERRQKRERNAHDMEP